MAKMWQVVCPIMWKHDFVTQRGSTCCIVVRGAQSYTSMVHGLRMGRPWHRKYSAKFGCMVFTMRRYASAV